MLPGIILVVNTASGRVAKITHVQACSPAMLEPGEVFVPGNPDIRVGDTIADPMRPSGHLLWLIARLTRNGGEAPAASLMPWAFYWHRKMVLSSLEWLEEVGLIKCRLAEDGFKFYSLCKEH